LNASLTISFSIEIMFVAKSYKFSFLETKLVLVENPKTYQNKFLCLFLNVLSSRVRVQTNVLIIGLSGSTIALGTWLGAGQVITKEL